MILDTTTATVVPEAEPSPAAPGDVASIMRSPSFIGVVFLATAVQVVAYPVLAILQGAATWDHPLSPAAVISLAILACALQASCLLLTGRAPVLAVLGTLGVYLAFTVGVGVPSWTPAMQLVVAAASFALAARARAATAIGWVAFTIVAAVAALAGWVMSTGARLGLVYGFVLDHGVGLAAPTAAGNLLGLVWASHARRTAEAREESVRTKREQEMRLTEARDLERARIAQELHDVAAQHVAGLVSLCDASMELAPQHPERALHLIDEVRAEGRFAAASLYGAIGDLRAVDEQTVSATPDLRRMGELIEFWTRHGMTVRLHTRGDVSNLPAVVSTTAYRGLQEALANAAKHAPGSTVAVEVEVHSDRLQITVSNTAAVATRPAEERIGLGWGLDGLRDKLGLVDGTLHAAADDRGGWRTRMDIPVPDLDGELND